jgi:hypothetical protein
MGVGGFVVGRMRSYVVDKGDEWGGLEEGGERGFVIVPS